MPALDGKRIPVNVGLNAQARYRATWPPCPVCGYRLHPLVQKAGVHPLCSNLPPDEYDRLAGWN